MRMYDFRCGVYADELDDACLVTAHGPKEAAQSYVEQNHANLDYRTELVIFTKSMDTGEVAKWEVDVRAIPEATARKAG